MVKPTTTDINYLRGLLSQRLHEPERQRVVNWCMADTDNFVQLYELSKSTDPRQAINALWCIASLPASMSTPLQALQDELIDRVLIERNPSLKRILMQLLRNRKYDKDSIRADFLDFCLANINAECESPGIRSYCIYCAWEMCRHYPELIAEFEEHLQLLSSSRLSPALRCALRNTRRKIATHNPHRY